MNVIGAQLYTVRYLFETEEQSRSTMNAIKDLGYTSVQLFGNTHLIRKHAAAAKEAGLAIGGILSNLDRFERLGDALFDLCDEYSIPDVGVSAHLSDLDEIKDFIRRVNAFAARAKARGLTFSYHNHASEFILTPCGKTVMELYLEGFDPDTVDFMPDTYWIQCGGYDVRRFLDQTKGRVSILHLKDMQYTKEGPKFAEVGQGNLYFEGIVQTALDCGIHNFFVEQDECDGNPIDSLKQSMDGIRKLGLL